MTRIGGVLLVTALLLSGCGVIKVVKQNTRPGRLAAPVNLGFEEGVYDDGDPKGWDRRGGLPDDYEFVLDRDVRRSGASSIRIHLAAGDVDDDQPDVSLIQCLEPKTYLGKPFTLSAWIRTDAIKKKDGMWGASLWIGAYTAGTAAVDTLLGSTWQTETVDWTANQVAVDVPEVGVREICFGPILYGHGTAWFDDLQVSSA